jgi:hypothetical protein
MTLHVVTAMTRFVKNYDSALIGAEVGASVVSTVLHGPVEVSTSFTWGWTLVHAAEAGSDRVTQIGEEVDDRLRRAQTGAAIMALITVGYAIFVDAWTDLERAGRLR